MELQNLDDYDKQYRLSLVLNFEVLSEVTGVDFPSDGDFPLRKLAVRVCYDAADRHSVLYRSNRPI